MGRRLANRTIRGAPRTGPNPAGQPIHTMENIAARIGFPPQGNSVDPQLRTYINLKLASIGCPMADPPDDGAGFGNLAASMLAHSRETARLLADYQCPADWRIQRFLDEYLYSTGRSPRLPSQTFILDRHGLARALSLPCDGDEFSSSIINSYRVKQGVLHNPAKDRRTTRGVFHVAEGGLPIPDDKKAVPLPTFARMLEFALLPPGELLRLPFTAGRDKEAECFVSLLLRPLVCPEVPGYVSEKRMEVRFFAPGNLVSNLDFVESIFGNGGDPFLPQNDAGLDPEHWSGHTGCIILAPHLTTITKVQAGLPHYDKASERQRRDGMCWRDEKELYNDGSAFKLTARNESGVVVTMIADNYFGYCKKEVKTQIGFAANLLGLAEEEHAGGALVFPSYDLGEEFDGALHVKSRGHSFAEASGLFSDVMDVKPEGYAIDRNHPSIIYVPENIQASIQRQTISWTTDDGTVRSIKLLPGRVYVRPSGYRLELCQSHGNGNAWRLVGTRADATYCHKPCTVSGGGKSEISKPISDAIIHGPVFVADFKQDFDHVQSLLEKDYSNRFRDPARNGNDTRRILSPERSLGSVIKLLTPAPSEYSDEYNDWLTSIPQHVKELLFVVKRFHDPSWGADWRSNFSVDTVNGVPGHELKLHNKPLMTDFLRVGFEEDGSWRVFSLRKDFFPAAKLQMEDDITASTIIPLKALENPPENAPGNSVKFAVNCEFRLFQRPDDAIHPGYDKQTESDFSHPGNFFSNFEPLRREDARLIVEDSIRFSKFTPPMQEAIRKAAESTDPPEFFVCSASPRIVDGKPSKNPRYLQTRQDVVRPLDAYLAEISQRLLRRVPKAKPLHSPVTAILPGRRNNPAEKGVRPLAVFNPIHYLELPELFLEFICSLTGKSPSTTGAGSEGALTKGPFNALPPIYDLNSALVGYLLTREPVFVTAAGYVGPHARMDHDVSLLVPEVWSRMEPQERDPAHLIAAGCLERVPDIEFEGRTLESSRLGWRINRNFVRMFFGRVFNYPHRVFTPEMLQPEKQDLAQFADGMDNIVETQKLVAELYFRDGGVDMAVPPLRALLHIMRDGTYEGKTLTDPSIRELFDPEKALASEWYRQRLESNAAADRKAWVRHLKNLQTFSRRPHNAGLLGPLGIDQRIEDARAELDRVSSPDYAASLHGTIGRQPI
jgi:phosphoenolpyruvate carboxykinase (diphosphate)